jgi:hypothetical protein
MAPFYTSIHFTMWQEGQTNVFSALRFGFNVPMRVYASLQIMTLHQGYSWLLKRSLCLNMYNVPKSTCFWLSSQ